MRKQGEHKNKRILSIALAVAMLVSVFWIPGAEPAVAAENEGAAEVFVPVLMPEVAGETSDKAASIPAADYDGYLCVLKEDATEEQIEQIEEGIAEQEAQGDPQAVEEISEEEIYRAESLEAIEETIDPEAIAYIEPDYLVQPFYSEDPMDHYNAQIYKTIGIKSVWKAGVTGKGKGGVRTPVIAVIDSGIAGWNKKSKRHVDLNFKRFPYAMKSSRFKNYEDETGHGTFVIGEISAVMGNHKGVTGLMPKAQVVPIRVIGKDGGRTSDVIKVMKSLTKKKRIDVINMSFGSPYYSATFAKICQKAAARGKILVAAAGNNGTTLFQYPASYDGVIGVAATTPEGGKWNISQHNDSVDIAAPGVSVAGLSAAKRKGYIQASGTSMAAPMVSALAAMVKSIDPTVKHGKFMKILKATSKDRGKKGYDPYFGYGIINYAKVYKYMKDPSSRPTHISAKPVKPKKAKITSLRAGKGKMKIRMRKLKKATSYQIAVKVKGGSFYILRMASRYGTIIGMRPGTKYYVKARGVRNVDGINRYGKWSKIKTVRIK